MTVSALLNLPVESVAPDSVRQNDGGSGKRGTRTDNWHAASSVPGPLSQMRNAGCDPLDSRFQQQNG